GDSTVRQETRGGGAEEDLCHTKGSSDPNTLGVHQLLSTELRRPLRKTVGRHPSGGQGCSCDLQPQRLSRTESFMGNVSQQSGTHRFPRVLPLSRWIAYSQRRSKHHAGLQHVP